MIKINNKPVTEGWYIRVGETIDGSAMLISIIDESGRVMKRLQSGSTVTFEHVADEYEEEDDEVEIEIMD